MRTHSNRHAELDRRPWLCHDRFIPALRTAFHLRSQLMPYVYTSARQCHADALPLLRPLYLEHPTLPDAYHNPQKYLFGDNLLVAPAVEQGCGDNLLARQSVWFPPGLWHNWFTGEAFEGPCEMLIAATIDEFPLYARGGTPIPLQPYAARMATTPLTKLILRCYRADDDCAHASTLYEDDGISRAFETGAFATTRLTYQRNGTTVTITIAPTQGTFANQPAQRAYEIECMGNYTSAKVVSPRRAVVIIETSYCRIILPRTNIRTGMKVTVQLNGCNSSKLRAAALRMRAAGLSSSAGAIRSTHALLQFAAKCAPKECAHLCAAAGVGYFQKNGDTTGFGGTVHGYLYCPRGIFDDDHGTAGLYDIPPPLKRLSKKRSGMPAPRQPCSPHRTTMLRRRKPGAWRACPATSAASACN